MFLFILYQYTVILTIFLKKSRENPIILSFYLIKSLKISVFFAFLFFLSTISLVILFCSFSTMNFFAKYSKQLLLSTILLLGIGAGVFALVIPTTNKLNMHGIFSEVRLGDRGQAAILSVSGSRAIFIPNGLVIGKIDENMINEGEYSSILGGDSHHLYGDYSSIS